MRLQNRCATEDGGIAMLTRPEMTATCCGSGITSSDKKNRVVSVTTVLVGLGVVRLVIYLLRLLQNQAACCTSTWATSERSVVVMLVTANHQIGRNVKYSEE